MSGAGDADEPYEQLVRQQLDALGYDSAAIPDDVRRIRPLCVLTLSFATPTNTHVCVRCCVHFSKTLTTRWSSLKTQLATMLCLLRLRPMLPQLTVLARGRQTLMCAWPSSWTRNRWWNCRRARVHKAHDAFPPRRRHDPRHLQRQPSGRHRRGLLRRLRPLRSHGSPRPRCR